MLANTLQYSCLENPPDREAWQATVYKAAELDPTQATLCTYAQDFFSSLP